MSNVGFNSFQFNATVKAVAKNPMFNNHFLILSQTVSLFNICATLSNDCLIFLIATKNINLPKPPRPLCSSRSCSSRPAMLCSFFSILSSFFLSNNKELALFLAIVTKDSFIMPNTSPKPISLSSTNR